MADKIHVFISYATKDATFVGRLREDLTRQGIAYWVDKEGLRPGTPNWEKGIRKGIQDAYAVIYVVTPNSYASEYVQGEIAVARMEGCTIFPVWLDGEWHNCVPIELVKSERVDVRGYEYERNRELLFDALRGKRPDLAVPPTMPAVLPLGVEPHNPYKGLNAFTEKDVDDFFGRDALVNELIDAVKGRIVANQDRILTVIGASGSGKSSVVMAGLLPKLKAGAISSSAQWTYLKSMVPGDHPVQSLNRVLLETPELNAPIDLIESDLKHPSGMGLYRLITKIPKKPVVLYIDQFEELFTTGVLEEERQQFISLLTYAVTQPDSPLLVLLTLRADFYDRPMSDPVLGRLVQSFNRSVLPMSIADLRDTVEKPAAAAGLIFESGLIADIVFDLRDDKNAQAGALPLLQYTLEQLYERRIGNTLTSAAYQEIGAVKGAIGVHAEEVFKTLDEEAQKAFSRVFQALVHVDEKGTPTRKREAEAVLSNQPASNRLVEALIKRARVLRVFTDKLGDTPYIEVAHEALLTSWQRLSEWIKSSDNDLRLIQEMKAAAARWSSEGKPKHRLWSHELLQPVYKSLARLQQDLSDEERFFIQPEAERLLVEFENSPEHVQLTMIERDFSRIGEAAVPVLVQAFGYRKSDEVSLKLSTFLWKFPSQILNPITLALKSQNKRIRIGAINLVAYFSITTFVPLLLDMLDENDSEIQIEVTQALGSIGDKRAIPVLQDVAANEDDDNLRFNISHALGKIRNKKVIDDLSITPKNRDRKIHPKTLETNKEINNLSKLLTDLNDNNLYIRRSAITALGRSRNVNAIPALTNILNDQEWEIRQRTVTALGYIGDKSAVPALTDSLKDLRPEVRLASVEALARIGDTSAVPELLQALRDNDDEVSKSAANCLVSIADESVVPILVLMLRERDSYIRRSAAEALGQIADASVVPDLLSALSDNDTSVKKSVAEALGQIGDENTIIALIDLLTDMDEQLRFAAERALVQIKSAQSISLLMNLLNHPFGAVNQGAFTILKLMDIPESRAALAEYDARHKG